MTTSHIHYSIVCTPKLKTQGSERDTAAGNIIQNMTRMLMCQNAAVATVDGDARKAGSAACRPYNTL